MNNATSTLKDINARLSLAIDEHRMEDVENIHREADEINMRLVEAPTWSAYLQLCKKIEAIELAELPTENPDYVKITCPLACELHGWTLNESYPTVPMYKKIDGYRDANGYNIYVNSVKWNHAVYLSSIEYSLPLTETITQ